jgi:hypothetical protein
LLVDDRGSLFALDSISGEVWGLPLEAVLAAVRGELLDADGFAAHAFKVATGHKGGLDLAATTRHLGFFVADAGGEINPVGAAIVGVLPDDVPLHSLSLHLPRFGTQTAVHTYSSGGKKRFMAHIPPALTEFNEGTLIASLNDSTKRVYHIPFVGPFFGVFFVPEDELAQILRGQ